MNLARLRNAPRVLAGYVLRWAPWVRQRAVAAIALGFFVVLALAERSRSGWRRWHGNRPRLLWGPNALVNNKYWSEAMREAGYESLTCIDLDSAITSRKDWDAVRDEFLGGRFFQWTRNYAMFAWALRHADVFLFYFDGGYLRGTPLDWLEFRLLRLAGKKLIFSPYGGDIADPEHLGEMRDATVADYPQLIELAPMIRKRVDHSLRWADVVIRNIAIGYLPAYNVVWLTQLAIDTDLWRPDGDDSGSDGRGDRVVVFTAPNHRRINGTEHLERAVGQLREEGLEIDLQIFEGRPNDEIRTGMQGADLVADQFLDPGYGMFPIEAMAVGKPMLTRMSPIPEELRTESIRGCPLVDTSPENLREQLRRLVTDSKLRCELGEAGREFALKNHSHEAVARDWGLVIEHAWRGAPLPDRLKPLKKPR